MKQPLIAPSVLSADFSRMAEGVAEITEAGADWVHLDVMDGHFVPSLTFGPKLVRDLRPHTAFPLDVHLMVSRPLDWIAPFAQAGADWITFHLEAETHAHRGLQAIRELGKKAGISIVPSTPVCLVEEILPLADLVLVMTVNPGWGGQPLIRETLGKVRALKTLRQARGLSYLISVDGGINAGTWREAVDAGADVLVMGTAFFDAPDRAALVRGIHGESFSL